MTNTQDGRTLDCRKAHGRLSFARARAEGARTRVADRDGIDLDRIEATVKAITPPVRSMSDLAITLDPHCLPAVNEVAGEDCAACWGDGVTECREDDNGQVWPTNTCEACEGTGKAPDDDDGELDPQAEAILADWRSAPTFRPFIRMMSR